MPPFFPKIKKADRVSTTTHKMIDTDSQHLKAPLYLLKPFVLLFKPLIYLLEAFKRQCTSVFQLFFDPRFALSAQARGAYPPAQFRSFKQCFRNPILNNRDIFFSYCHFTIFLQCHLKTSYNRHTKELWFPHRHLQEPQIAKKQRRNNSDNVISGIATSHTKCSSQIRDK